MKPALGMVDSGSPEMCSDLMAPVGGKVEQRGPWLIRALAVLAGCLIDWHEQGS